jgi:hypothetical protein
LKSKFPGFEACLKSMRKHNPQLQEDGFWLLMPYAHQFADELITEFQKETDHGLRCWLLELIAEAKSPKAFPLLVDSLRGDDDSLWSYAVSGLIQLDTKAARNILWEAKLYTKSTQEKTQYFQKILSSAD